MTQRALILAQQSRLREGMCVICVTRVCARACHTNVAYPPFHSPPLSGARFLRFFADLRLRSFTCFCERPQYVWNFPEEIRKSSGKIPETLSELRWPGRRFAARIGAIRVNRFARIDSQTKKYFHNSRAIRTNHRKSAIRNFQPPKARFEKKRGSVREP